MRVRMRQNVVILMSAIELTPAQQEAKRRLRAVWIAIAASFLVCAVELSLGWVLGLESLIAEGIHTFFDGFDSIIVLGAVIIAARPADRGHPFGHGKFEALGATVEAFFILFAAIMIGYRAIGLWLRGETPKEIPPFVAAVMIGAAILYFFISRYLLKEAEATRSPALLAEGKHLQVHVFITAGVAVGLLVGAIGNWPFVDTLLALAVAVCLLVISIGLFRELLRQFTDAALPQDEIDKLAGVIRRFSDRFVEVHGVRTRQAGTERHIEMHMVVMPETKVGDAHALSHEIADAVTEVWPAARTTVHIEPLNTDDERHEKWIEGQPKVHVDEHRPDDREFIS